MMANRSPDNKISEESAKKIADIQESMKNLKLGKNDDQALMAQEVENPEETEEFQAAEDPHADIPTETAIVAAKEEEPEGALGVKKEKIPDSEVELSAIEQEAYQKGWRPQEEFIGNEDQWIDAKSYLERKKLYDKLSASHKTIKNLEKSIEFLTKSFQKQQEKSYQTDLSSLEAQRLEAVQNGDLATFQRLDHQIRQFQDNYKNERQYMPEPSENSVDPLIQKFEQDNSDWYKKDDDMTMFAQQYSNEIATKYGNTMSLPAQLESIQAAVHARFPDYFSNRPTIGRTGGRVSPVRAAPSPVSRTPIQNKVHTPQGFADLPKEAKTVFHHLKRRMPQLDGDQYAEEYFKQFKKD